MRIGNPDRFMHIIMMHGIDTVYQRWRLREKQSRDGNGIGVAVRERGSSCG
jgi:hypothetical protein